MFQTSTNEVEFFAEAIWNDGKVDLVPQAVGEDGSKIVTSAPKEEVKAEPEEPVAPKEPSTHEKKAAEAGAKAAQEHSKVVAVKEKAKKKI